MGASPTTQEMIVKYMAVAVEKCPKNIQPYVQKATPIVVKIVEIVEKLIPLVEKLYMLALKYWIKLQPYKPELLLPSFIGFVMCFFGGSFMTLIAAVEAWNMCGSEATIDCIKMLYKESKKLVEENKKDDAKDDDGDGVSDVLQTSTAELAKRKTLLFFRVVDPQIITDAMAGITAGFMAVIAALKLQFAKTIALGNAIANTVEPPAMKYLLPAVETVLPEEYKKWGKPVITYTIKSIAVSIAWTVQRVISAFHSAIRGGLMCSRNIMEYLSVMKIYPIDHETSSIDEIAGYGLALVGLYFQLAYGFGLPFPLNVILFPFTLLEYFLMAMINK